MVKPPSPWLVYPSAATIGLLGSLAVIFTEVGGNLGLREELLASALGVAFGIGLALIVAGRRAATRYRERPRSRPARYLVAVLCITIGGAVSFGSTVEFIAVAADDRGILTTELRDVPAALGRMPGVHHASAAADAPFANDTFSAVVVLTADASAEQAEAVVQAFRDQMTAPVFHRWEVDIELRRGNSESTFQAGKAGLDSAPGRAAQWVALADAFPKDQVTWTYHTWFSYHRGFLAEETRRRDEGMGVIRLRPRVYSYQAISDTYRQLIRDFPELAGAWWRIGDDANGRTSLKMAHRYPTELELSVWNRLSEDQQTPHIVEMELMSWDYTNRNPWVPSLVIAEHVTAAHPSHAEQLAERHLPIVAELGVPVHYAAAKSLPGDWDSPGTPLHITLGGCTRRDYTPTPLEQTLATHYERC